MYLVMEGLPVDPRNLAATSYAPPTSVPQYQQLLGALRQMQCAPTVPTAPPAPPVDTLTLSQSAAPASAVNPALTPYIQNGTISRLTEMLHKLLMGQPAKQEQPKAPASPAQPEPKPEPKPEGSGPLLRQGANGDPVRRLQDRLRELGFDPGATDGAMGPKTVAAVKGFQQAKGLQVDGIVGPQTWTALGIKVDGQASAPKPEGSGPLLKQGANGDPVRRLQDRLRELGFDPGATDGAMGPKTVAAVKGFQQSKGLQVDGIVGPKTWTELGIKVEGQVSMPKPGGSGPLLKQGANGDPVRKLQDRLRELGFDPGASDGAMGPRTVAAVKGFQQSKGLQADGIVGPKTWTELGIRVEGQVHQTPGGNSDEVINIGGPKPAVRRQGHYIGAHLAGQFDAMVAAAARDGINLQISSGYRSRAEQEELWRANPNPKYVARPGTSNHEKGDAIDFRNTPGAYDWLKRNATRFGFHNYPPEPWHYSLNGG